MPKVPPFPFATSAKDLLASAHDTGQLKYELEQQAQAEGQEACVGVVGKPEQTVTARESREAHHANTDNQTGEHGIGTQCPKDENTNEVHEYQTAQRALEEHCQNTKRDRIKAVP